MWRTSSVKNTVLQAPFSGVLCEVAEVKEGERVTRGAAIARLQDRSALVVTLRFGAQAQEALSGGTVLDVEIEDAEIVIAAFGIAARVAKNAVNAARAEGIKAGLIRPITLWPFPEKTFQKIMGTAKQIISVELSMGQMIEDVKLSTQCRIPVTLCNRAGGMIPSPEQVFEAIKAAAGKAGE